MVSFNEYRESAGMPVVTSFLHFSGSNRTAEVLRALYDHEDALELYPGKSPRNPRKSFLEKLRSKNKNPVLGSAIPVLGVKPKRGSYFSNFLTKTYIQPHQWKAVGRDLLNDMTGHKNILKSNQNT